MRQNPCKITKILITHLHGDHTLGIPGLLKTLEMSEYRREIEIYGPKGTINHIRSLERIYGKFGINLQVHEKHGVVFDGKEFQILSAPMAHGIETLGFSFIIKDKRKINKKLLEKMGVPNSPLLKNLQEGKKVKIENKTLDPKKMTYIEEGKKITFILDTLPNPNATKLAKDSDLLVCESTFSKKDELIAKDHKHMTAEQAATIAKKSGSKTLMLTHISQRYEHSLSELLQEAKKVFKNTSIAEDLQSVEI